MATWFDESRLDDEGVLAQSDGVLRPLAESGARVRQEAGESEGAIAEAVRRAAELSQPRAVIAAGPDSRLLRAVLEPTCPVPFVAWPHASLPGWAGGLDLAAVLAPEGGNDAARSAAEAVRRGCQLVVACPPDGSVAEHAAGRWSSVLPTRSRDQLATAVTMLEYLHRVRLGPASDAEEVARALDAVAVSCSPHRDLAVNTAKMLAISLADANPVVWGGSVLAARAARRVAERIRRASGQGAIAGDVDQLLPVLEAAIRRDVFDDPFADAAGAPAYPMLLILDDGTDTADIREQRGRLRAAAESRGVRIETITTDATEEVARYASLVLSGSYAAAYLELGLVSD